MASVTCYKYSLTKVSTAANLRLLFGGRMFLKLLKRLTVGQAVPEIPLSVGSKLELLLRVFVFANFISVYFSIHSHICPCMHIAVYICVYYISYMYIQCIYMTETPKVMHFSAFINTYQEWYTRS